MNVTPRIGILILAAGCSSRLGRPKQFLVYKGKPLLLHTISQFVDGRIGTIAVVTGSSSGEIEFLLKGHPVQVIYNPDWESGMATSIVCGVKALSSDCDALLICGIDQPHISQSLISRLIDTHMKPGDHLATASIYGGKRGIPALFSKELFDQLASLSGDKGAREILRGDNHRIAEVRFPKGEIDIDKESDLKFLS